MTLSVEVLGTHTEDTRRNRSRTHGDSARGRRCHGQHDGHAKGRINVIGARLDRPLINVGLFQGDTNSEVFHAWLTQQFLPCVPAGAVIVMDNATFHKRHDAQQAIVRSGRILKTLPAYSFSRP
jgi:hypothetical protein